MTKVGGGAEVKTIHTPLTYKKLDKRFRMKKAGIAEYVMNIDILIFKQIQDALQSMYGSGTHVTEWRPVKYVPRGQPWYYQFKRDTDKLRPSHKYQVYLKSEDQIMMLAMKIPGLKLRKG